ncbi:YcgN family cysteine cluster protein [Shewanella colwelliana]|uniref:YcgN family cysteine cluster protein n=1 Tax=Shewanella colwelliana TaxID=23 RepID=UPI0022AECB14|nr:YcgN family cysteine cluster protein [Shewanella colwelliana]MCZ4336907.1 YcgN family cysteine cluster protein [Shewanella colwelliana]
MSFWKEKTLAQLTSEEWELLCDGCGKCCLNKVIDDETEELYYTNAACKLLDPIQCQCQQYDERFTLVPGCTKVTLDNIASLTWLPDSCAYRRIYQGRDLPSWHPLLAGDKQQMHANGMSTQNKIVNETKVKYLEDHIVLWPLKDCD